MKPRFLNLSGELLLIVVSAKKFPFDGGESKHLKMSSGSLVSHRAAPLQSSFDETHSCLSEQKLKELPLKAPNNS